MKLGRVGWLGLAAIVVAVLVANGDAQAPYDAKANYVKREVMIPMRDGVKLFTIIYTPKASTRSRLANTRC